MSSAYEDSISIEGTRGLLRLSTFGDSPLELETSAGRAELALSNPEHIQQPLIQTIVDSLPGKGDCPSTGYSAARTSAVMDQVLVGYYGRRDDGFWKDPAAWPGRTV